MNIPVTYMSGAGNIFTVIDGRESVVSIEQWQKLTPLLCSGEFPTEGLIILNNSEILTKNNKPTLNFTSEFFNPDGSHGAMCGNGGRCAVRFALNTLNDPSFSNSISTISFTMAGTAYQAEIIANEIRVYFPMPVEFRENIEVSDSIKTIHGDFVDVGSQHFVVNYNQLQTDIPFREFEIEVFAPPFRFHKVFEPRGANINLYEVVNNKINLRTYERGVEAETGACGTGAISTAVSTVTHNLVQSPVTIIPPSGIQLTVGYEPENSVVWLQGTAEFIGDSVFSV
ncbi:MAG: diaminopimelate epimerase [Ignavibacteriae bacterium]|nr:diaminopimelate epimerase [Ignavibacteriota bacterium]